MNEPKTRNALSKQMIGQLKEYTAAINNDPEARVCILKSANPKMFCAGANLKERKGMDDFATEQFVANLR